MRAKVSTNAYYIINNTTRKKVNSVNGSNEFEILLLVKVLIPQVTLRLHEPKRYGHLENNIPM